MTAIRWMSSMSSRPQPLRDVILVHRAKRPQARGKFSKPRRGAKQQGIYLRMIPEFKLSPGEYLAVTNDKTPAFTSGVLRRFSYRQ